MIVYLHKNEELIRTVHKKNIQKSSQDLLHEIFEKRKNRFWSIADENVLMKYNI